MYNYYDSNNYDNSNNSNQPINMGFAPQPPKKKRGRIIVATALACAFIVSAVGFGTFALKDLYLQGALDTNSTIQLNENADNNNNKAIALVSRPETSSEVSQDGPYSIQQIAQLITPSVVGIETMANAGIKGMQTLGQGSGIIMTEDGYIVTNAHVINGSTQIIVILNDETEYEATIVGSDSKTDLAVLKIDAKGLPYAEFGDSSQAQVGEEVVAIGNAAGLANTVTNGIISALDRDVYSETSYALKCIQTNAAINPGNSGGALINMYGQVIGINSAKLVSTNYEGLGFAIAISEAEPVINELISNGYVAGRVRIGIGYDLISKLTAQMYNAEEGIYVMQIDETAPVAESGLEVYDIITYMNGVRTLDGNDVSEVLVGLSAGDTLKCTVFRMNQNGNSETVEINITLTEEKGTDWLNN